MGHQQKKEYENGAFPSSHIVANNEFHSFSFLDIYTSTYQAMSTKTHKSSHGKHLGGAADSLGAMRGGERCA